MAVTFMATLLFSGCQKDSVTLRIRINDFGGNGKVYMDSYNPHWSSSEAFRINGEDYQVNGISGNNISLSVPSSPSYSAFYPSQFYSSTDGNAIHFTLPRVQYYEVDGNNQLVKAPMAAFATTPSQTSSSVPITFNNIGALLAINIDNNLLPNTATLTVDSVVVTTVGNTLPLWGDAVLPDITDPNSYYQCVNTPDHEKYYTVSVAKGNGDPLFTLNNGVSRKVYIFIPSAEALSSNKFKITVYYCGGRFKEREQTSSTGGLIRHGMMATVSFEMRQVEAPTGAVSGGKFSVSANTKVWFSAGNLQWKPTTNMGTSRSSTTGDRGTWRIAPRQWDYIGYEATSGESSVKWGTVVGSYNNGIEEANYAGWIDLFGWATSGYNAGSTYFHPYQYINASGYGPSADLIGTTYANCDWGVYNTITYNGNPTTSSWRSLTSLEWGYVLGVNSSAMKRRTVNGGQGLHYCFSPVKYKYHNGDSSVYGIVIYHDDYSGSSLSSSANYCPDITEIPAGCVFLPVTSYRTGSSIQPTDTPQRSGYYWSTTSSTSSFEQAARLTFITSGTGSASVGVMDRYFGYAVRLVTPVQ